MTTPNEETLKQIFVNPSLAAKVVNAIVPTNKPKGWSRRSNAPYYREVYALQLKAEVDKMINDRQDRLYYYEAWKQFTPNTLYLRLNQSKCFLLDHMDADGKYRKLFELVDISRDRKNKAIRVAFRPEFQNNGDSDFKPETVVPSAEMPKWRAKMEEWTQKTEPGGAPFVLQNLALTPEEVVQLKSEFAGLANVMAYITCREIKLIKIVAPKVEA